MKTGTAFRGQPLLLLIVLICGWVLIRLALWETPFEEASFQVAELVVASQKIPSAKMGNLIRSEVLEFHSDGAAQSSSRHEIKWPNLSGANIEQAHKNAVGLAIAPGESADFGGRHSPLQPSEASVIPTPYAATVSPQMPAPVAPSAVLFAANAGGRWSADAWLLLRKDTTATVTSGRGSYGKSQAGAVLRYQLVPSSGHRPDAYLRASQALSGVKESEVALGLAARPLPDLPVAVAAEMRLTRSNGGTFTRPAAYAVTQLPVFDLALGLRAEAYAQAGYVGGDFATGFVDGQLRLERMFARMGGTQLRLGGGVWGGAQKGAARLDAGPGVTLALDIDGTPARVSLDWRFRIAGQAEPSTGPALIISAEF